MLCLELQAYINFMKLIFLFTGLLVLSSMSAGASVPLNRAKVTEEFSKVLEQILKRSQSTGDTSPYERQLEAVADLEIVEETLPKDTPTDNGRTPVVSPTYGRNHSYKTASQDDQLNRSSPESDGVHRAGTHSSTGTSTGGTLPHTSGHVADDSSDSSDSNISRNSNKKKKSFFKKARERVRESFKRRTEKSVDSDFEVDNVETSPRRHKRKQKKQKQNGAVKRTDSIVSPGQHSVTSGAFSEIHTHTHTTVDHKLSGYGDISGYPNELHIEKTQQSCDLITGDEDSLNKHVDVNFTLRESHPSKGRKLHTKDDKENNFLDTLRKFIKKRSSKSNKGMLFFVTGT